MPFSGEAVPDRSTAVQRQYCQSCQCKPVSCVYLSLTLTQYSDALYICTIVSAAACATVSTAPPERGELLPSEVRTEHNAEDANLLAQTLVEIDRYRSMDRLIPSTHNIVTTATLEVRP